MTVRDQLNFTALLRLPSTMTKAQKFEEVQRVINQLRLQRCADTPIILVSGGEKKRTNIGTELLTNPLLVLLDEPTSGLVNRAGARVAKQRAKIPRLTCSGRCLGGT